MSGMSFGLSSKWQFCLVGNIVGRIDEVNQCRAQLVLGWVNHLGM